MALAGGLGGRNCSRLKPGPIWAGSATIPQVFPCGDRQNRALPSLTGFADFDASISVPWWHRTLTPTRSWEPSVHPNDALSFIEPTSSMMSIDSRTARYPVLLLLALFAIVGCGTGSNDVAEDVLGTDRSMLRDMDTQPIVLDRQPEAASETETQLDLSLVTPRHFMVTIVDGQQLRDYFAEREKSIDQVLLEPKPESISLDDVQSLIFMMDDSLLTGLTPGAAGTGGWTVQLNFQADVDHVAWQKWLLAPYSRETKINDRAAHIAADGTTGLMWLDRRRLVLASREELGNITQRLGQVVPSPLVRRIRTNYRRPFLFTSIQAEPLQKLMDQAGQMAASFGQSDERLDQALAGARALEFARFEADLENPDLGQLTLEFADAQAADGVESLINQGIDQIASFSSANGGPMGASAGANNPAAGISRELQNLLGEIQNEFASGGLLTQREDRTVTVRMNRPQRFDELIDQSLQGWQEGKKRLYQSRKAGAISVALQRFVARHGHWPRNNGSPLEYQSSSEDGPPADGNIETGPQFSWRVAILPQLGYQELYDQFDFTKPWDDPVNQKAALTMPAEYDWNDIPESGQRNRIVGEDAPPQSDFHMVTGVGAAANIGTEPVAIPDGEDRTLAVLPTPHLRSSWTEPDSGWEVSEINDLVDVRGAPPETLVGILFSGRVVMIAPQMSADDWFQWITPNGKERINRNQYREATIFAPIEDLK